MSEDIDRKAVSHGKNQLAGILLALGAMVLFCLMDLQAKYLGQTISVTQIVWARYFGLFVIMMVIFWPKRGMALVRSQRPWLQWIRSLLLLFCTFAFFIAIQYMPLADAVSISFLSPLLVTALSVPLLGVAFGYALYQITTRMIAGKDNAVTSLFFTAAVGAGLVTLIIPFFWSMPVEPIHWLMLGSLGIIGGLGHYALIKSFEFAPVAVLAPLSYTALPWNTLFGYWVFGDLPDRWTVIGASILIATGIYILYREGIRGKA